MVDSGHMPASHHDFALRDMAHSRSAAAAFARRQPGRAECAVAFFPGCQLSASSPWHVERVYAHLAAKIPGGVGLMVDCCGAPGAVERPARPSRRGCGGPARDLAQPRRAANRHRLLDLPEDARRIPPRDEGALAVDNDRRDRLAGRPRGLASQVRSRFMTLHRPPRDRRAARGAAARRRARRRAARTRRRGTDDLLRFRRPGVVRQSGSDGQDRRPAHRGERRRLSDLLRDVPRQFRPPRQALDPSARSRLPLARGRRSGGAARSWLFAAARQPGSPQGAYAARNMGGGHDRPDAGDRR